MDYAIYWFLPVLMVEEITLFRFRYDIRYFSF